MRRGSRKKQDAASSREEAKAPLTAPGAARRQQPPQEILQQQRKKHQDEVTSLTTKNYRLAKELADLRLKHRDECKHVTRLTMENMNLASRCREAISHVAMLKKELAMQQKRTAQALASQREQTKRMTDSLTNSFISLSSPESAEPKDRTSNNKSHRISVGIDDDENVMRLVSTTPSPTRDGLRHRPENENSDSNNDEDESYSKLIVQTSTTTTSVATTTTRQSSPMEEPRDSPATTATNSPTSELDEDDTVTDSIALASSALSERPEKENNYLSHDKETKKLPPLYSTPKKSERSKPSQFHVESLSEFSNTTAKITGLFPISASPQVFNKSNTNRNQKSYEEGFPSDTIDQPESNDDGKYAKSKRNMNLMTSIDAFEKSFSTDFPDSFTPKESNSNGSLKPSGSKQVIYNPFFATPEKSKYSADSSICSAPTEEKSTCEPSKAPQIEYKTPPKNAMNVPFTSMDKNDKDEGRPKRPEKIIPSAARVRYERALGPRVESSTISKQPVRIDIEKGSSSDDNSPGALFRRMQQKKRMGKNLESASNGSAAEAPPIDSSSLEQMRQSHKSILNIVDTFELSGSGNADVGKERKSSISSRFQGPIKSLRRRSVKKPISYAEPPLNTKLRRGDTFFPKTGPNMKGGNNGNGYDDQNQVPALIQPSAVVSP